MTWLDAAFAWLFFHHYPWPPMGLYGLVCIGWIARGWIEKRRSN